ncbi:ATP-binding protein [Embleya sp. NPDC050154]|uniref:ATP-binding protein n=1 Tax=Embleya sp. NPDC050154 TaxID=3363988 RepID=UPI0037928266
MPDTEPSINRVLRTAGIDPTTLATTDPDAFTPLGRVRSAVDVTEAKLPARYRDAVTDHPDVIAWTREVVTQARAEATRLDRPMPSVSLGPSLMLLGITGVGKTHQIHGAIRLIAAHGVFPRAILTSAADLYASLRPRHNVDSETEYRRYADAGLLVVDDLGAAKHSEWVEEINYRLINHRYDRGAVTVVTSNLEPGPLKDSLGERVASRLREMCRRVSLKGDDRRRAAA